VQRFCVGEPAVDFVDLGSLAWKDAHTSVCILISAFVHMCILYSCELHIVVVSIGLRARQLYSFIDAVSQ
jgi:hypothetical protein